MNTRNALAVVGALVAGVAGATGRDPWLVAELLERARRSQLPTSKPVDRHGFTWLPLTEDQHENNRKFALRRDIKRINNKTAKRQAKADGCKCWKHERRLLKGLSPRETR